MEPALESYIVPIFVAFITSIFTLAGAYLAFSVNIKRMGPQNFRDDMDAAQTALQISENSVRRQKDLEDELSSLRKILTAKNYRVTVIFTLGEIPRIEKATVESVED
jgi:hypothetical protein